MKKRLPLWRYEKRTVFGAWDSWIWVRRAGYFLVPWFSLCYAEKDGSPVLKGEASWRKLNGVQMHAGTWQLWLQFRRRP